MASGWRDWFSRTRRWFAAATYTAAEETTTPVALAGAVTLRDLSGRVSCMDASACATCRDLSDRVGLTIVG